MTPRQRLVAALEGRASDRVPVSLYEMSHLTPDAWYARCPDYEPLLAMQRELGDPFAWANVRLTQLTGDANAVRWDTVPVEGGSEVVTCRLATPRGELTQVGRRDPGVATMWQLKPFIETPEDARAYLSLPVEPIEVDPAPVLELQARAGEQALVLVGPGDPLGHVAGLFHYDNFALMLLEDEGLILELLRAWYERLRAGLEQLCSAVTGVAVRFWGPEYAGAPLINPHRYFPKLVVPFLQPLIERVNASGNYSLVHCHGRLDAILEMIADMQPTALEPLELLPASTADVTMADIKARIGGRVCLMGGLQANELEHGTPESVAARVRTVLADGAPDGRFVLLPTATPITATLPPKVLANYRAYFETARECGAKAGEPA